MVELV